jgi:hypothetical protein
MILGRHKTCVRRKSDFGQAQNPRAPQIRCMGTAQNLCTPQIRMPVDATSWARLSSKHVLIKKHVPIKEPLTWNTSLH